MPNHHPSTIGDIDAHRTRWEESVDEQLNNYGQRLTVVEVDLRRVDATTMRIEKDNAANFNDIKRSLAGLEVKSGTYGTLPAKAVVTICISLVGLFISTVGVSLTAGVVLGRLALTPIVEKLTEEIRNGKLTDIEVAKNHSAISALQATQKANAERMDGLDDKITDTKEWLLEKSDDTRLLLDAMNIQSMLDKAAARDDAFLRALQEIADGKD